MGSDETSEKILKATEQTGTSVFDPVLCEIAYRWFSPAGGTVVDPFAGGSVRGIVAGCLGREYLGVDLSERQVEANREQANAILSSPSLPFPSPVMPRWFVGDSTALRDHLPPGTKADLIFSCPPYADLERYSDDPRDLSAMGYADFLEAYQRIVREAAEVLREDRFACFVVGDVRAKGEGGRYRGFPWHTVEAFGKAGLRLYNEAVLVTMVASLSLRTAKQFTASRKLGKTHQNVLVFVKGDPRKATIACGEVEFGEGLAETADYVLGLEEE